MWQPKAGTDALARARAFDVVIEPGELASAFDRGPTRALQERTRHVAPIRLLDSDELLPRPEARAVLRLPDDHRAVLIQLGSGNNFDYARLRRRVLELLAGRPELEPVVVVSPIAQAVPDLPAQTRVRHLFPVARYLAAFDAAVSAAGYNSFHELLTAGVPTLFVPNENPSMDDQLGRAAWAAQAGLALMARAAAPFRLEQQLDELLDEARLAQLRLRLGQVAQDNGAEDAARIVAEMAFTLRADRPWTSG
jgi:UDP:flavonoid glycosyltransferase YjiC (YdhE family)